MQFQNPAQTRHARLPALAAAILAIWLPLGAAQAHDPCAEARNPVAIAEEDAVAEAVAEGHAEGLFSIGLEHASPASALGRLIEVELPAGTRSAAALAHVAAALPHIDAAFARAEAGPATARSVGARGLPVTIRLLPASMPISAEAWTSCERGDCSVELAASFWQGAGRTQMAFTLAHEFFHVAQMLAYPEVENCNAHWWVEGSAEWFANMAIPGQNFSATFLNNWGALSDSRSLTQLDYEAVAFFFWAGERFGPSFPLTLGRHGDGALRSIERISSLFGAEDWADLTRRYLDGALTFPDGRPALPSPHQGSETAASPGADLRLEGPALSIPRQQITLEPGLWLIRLEEAAPGAVVQLRDSEGGWHLLEPGDGLRLPADCDGSTRVLLASAGATRGDLQARLVIEQDEEREPCEVCHIGAWQSQGRPWIEDFVRETSIGLLGGLEQRWVTPDGYAVRIPGREPVEIMHRFGDEGALLVIQPDGNFAFSDPMLQEWFGGEAELTYQYDTNTVYGRWSVRRGILRLMSDTRVRQGRMIFPGGVHLIDERERGATSGLGGAQAITCNARQLILDRQDRDRPPMQVVFDRLR